MTKTKPIKQQPAEQTCDPSISRPFAIGDTVRVTGWRNIEAEVRGFHPKHPERMVLCEGLDRRGNYHQCYFDIKDITLIKAEERPAEAKKIEATVGPINT
jgi:hypothetical protein